MPLKLKIPGFEITMEESWIKENEFIEIGSDGVKKLIEEDISSFLDSFGGIEGFLGHCEFYWSER
jgi:hypothetical protein